MWYQQGLTMDLSTLLGAGDLGAMLVDVGYTFDALDEMADVDLVESTGGSYVRQDVTGVTLNVATAGIVRPMTPDVVSFPRPTSSPGWLVLYRTSDDALVLAIDFTDDALDPIVIDFLDDIIGTRRQSPLEPFANARIINTNGLPGRTIYIGTVEPEPPDFDVIPGDIWIDPDGL